ncbi:MAG: phosphatase PAP2 family protein [Prolixibacteraceae bacterium]|nr:phosphatase PAP2 family protein [Prolixibacteraceae bacterium]MBN2648253.1 phosphatase PAP2 family protein [Prolixibacteraceae bacterium]
MKTKLYISKNILVVLSMLALLALSPTLCAQPDSLIRKSFKHLLNNGIALVKSPIQWNKTDWIVLGSATAFTTASIAFFDEPVQRYLSTHRNLPLEKSLSVFDYSDFYYTTAIVTGFTAAGFISKNNYTIETAYMIAESCFYSALLTRTIKIVAGRDRPNHWQGPDAHNWDIESDGRSFFSGHTSMAFAAASVISWRYRHQKWIPWLSYGLASTIGFQRMYYNRHWLSDVAAGAVSATAIGLFIAKNDIANPLKLYPIVTPHITGLSMIIPIP